MAQQLPILQSDVQDSNAGSATYWLGQLLSYRCASVSTSINWGDERASFIRRCKD